MTAAAIARMHTAVMEDRNEQTAVFASRDAAYDLAPLAAAFWMDDASWWPYDLDPMPEGLGERIWAKVQAELGIPADPFEGLPCGHLRGEVHECAGVSR